MANEKRTRNWICVFYPESAPDDWREQLDAECVEYVLSPLHDKDVNPDGEVKKPHYHLLLMFGGVKTFQQAVNFIEFLNCPIPKICNSVKGTVRYWAHLDNPEKYQYPINQIECHGGFTLEDLLAPTASEVDSILKEILEYLRAEHVIEFSDLIDYCNDEGRDDWFYVASNRKTLFLKTYIASLRHKGEC